MKKEFEDYLYMVPKGWEKATKFLLDGISKYIESKPEEFKDFKILDMKEKYGEGRCYVSFSDDYIDKLIDDWERTTANTCVNCGNQAFMYSKGYVLPFCKECYEKE